MTKDTGPDDLFTAHAPTTDAAGQPTAWSAHETDLSQPARVAAQWLVDPRVPRTVRGEPTCLQARLPCNAATRLRWRMAVAAAGSVPGSGDVRLPAAAW